MSIFGGNTGITYEQLQQRRKLADNLRTQNSRTPQNVGEGIHSVARALVARGVDKQTAARTKEMRDQYSGVFDSLMGGGSYGGSYGGSSGPVGTSFNPAAPNPLQEMFPEGREVDPNAPPDTRMVEAGGQQWDAGKEVGAIPPKPEISSYIMQAAQARGIDPNVALRVAETEGLNADPGEAWQSRVVKNGKRERSYGPYQLYIDGGLGNEFMTKTGMDPRDPTTWQAQVDFALDHAAQNGWGAWYGARDNGIPNNAGIPGGTQYAQAGGGRVSTQGNTGSPSTAQLVQLLSAPDEFVSPGQKAVAQALLQRQMQGSDPMRQLDMQYKQAQIDRLQNPEPNPPASVEEYQFAQQNGFDGSYQDWVTMKGQSGAPSVSTTFNTGDGAPGIGKLSTDFGYVLDPETREPVIDEESGLPQAAPVPGSPAWQDRRDEEDAATAKQRNASDYARTVTQDIGIADEYLSQLGPMSGMDGVIGANLRKARAGVAGTPEYNMSVFVDSAMSNLTLDTMNRMRETSAAGATGMGNMSDKQLRVIQGVLGQWDPGLPVDDQRYILHRLGNFYMDVQVGTADERAKAVREWRMKPEENAEIEQLYYPETRDGRGKPVEGGGLTFEQFSADPSAQAAADRHGVTLEEMWEIKNRGQ